MAKLDVQRNKSGTNNATHTGTRTSKRKESPAKVVKQPVVNSSGKKTSNPGKTVTATAPVVPPTTSSKNTAPVKNHDKTEKPLKSTGHKRSVKRVKKMATPNPTPLTKCHYEVQCKKLMSAFTTLRKKFVTETERIKELKNLLGTMEICEKSPRSKPEYYKTVRMKAVAMNIDKTRDAIEKLQRDLNSCLF